MTKNISREEIISSLIANAKSAIGKSFFVLAADPEKAPLIVDCSSFTKWAFSRVNVELPRHSIEQRRMGKDIDLSQARKGDLIFTTGRYGRNFSCKIYGNEVGHVGIITDKGVIHATYGLGVVEITLEEFLQGRNFRGVKRII